MLENEIVGMKRNKILLAGGIVFASEIIWHLYKGLYSAWTKFTNTRNVSRTNVDESKQNISEVMFFTNESSLCRAHVADDVPCVKESCPVSYLRKLENYINQAEHSLDVCVYLITCQLLSNAIVNAHKRGVLVRIIMDSSMACTDGGQIDVFYNNGVPIRLKDLDVLMHHKFVIVDNDIVITGSTNWTMSAFFGNFEHVLVTNHVSLVKPFVGEFNRLWNIFSKSPETSMRLVKASADNGL